jgi:inositol 1,4,5-triphosphate receptor type 1
LPAEGDPSAGLNFGYHRFGWDNLFNAIVTVFMVQILGGLIVDTFGVLREESEKKEEIMNTSCFICGIHKDLFDRMIALKGGWAHHFKREHNLWAYLFFLSYIKSKPKDEYNGVESEVAAKIENKDMSWFPINRALGLENVDREVEEAEDDTQEQLAKETERLTTRFAMMMRKISGLQQLIDEKKEKIRENVLSNNRSYSFMLTLNRKPEEG